MTPIPIAEPAILVLRVHTKMTAGVTSPAKIRKREGQGMSGRVTIAEVERVAELAHLELTPEESAHMLTDLNAILDYVAELNELDTTGIEPLASVAELFDTPVGDLMDPASRGGMRADALRPSLDRTVVMAQAPDTDNAFFKVPKVIER